MSDLSAFLLAQIEADAAAARAASQGGWSYPGIESVAGGLLYDADRTIAQITWDNPGDHDGSIVRFLSSEEADANGRHIARHDPARVLADCEALRAVVAHLDTVVDLVAPEPLAVHIRMAMLALAQPFAGRPGWDESWRMHGHKEAQA